MTQILQKQGEHGFSDETELQQRAGAHVSLMIKTHHELESVSSHTSKYLIDARALQA